MSVLTPGQAQIVSVVRKGHNLLITGQAGSGKSTVVKEIMSALGKTGFNVSVVCASGIACTVYMILGSRQLCTHIMAWEWLIFG